jgi:hypothetical protein
MLYPWPDLHLGNQRLQGELISKLKHILILLVLDQGVSTILDQHLDNILVSLGLLVLAHLQCLVQGRIAAVCNYIIGLSTMVEQDPDELRFLPLDGQDEHGFVVGGFVGLMYELSRLPDGVPF